jgi:hypothetical protein
MRDMVVRFSFCHCLVNVRKVLSSTPRTRYVSEGPMDGMGEECESMVMNCFEGVMQGGCGWLGRGRCLSTKGRR